MKHKHKFKISGFGGPNHQITYTCPCKKTYVRVDKKLIQRIHAKSNRQSNAIHRVFQEFESKLKLGTVRHSDYELMEKARRIHGKFPKDIAHVGCDDTHFSSSDLYLVAHRDKKRYWMGITVVGLMQNDGQEPFEFFLYPNHVKRMIETLQYFEKLRKKCKNQRGL